MAFPRMDTLPASSAGVGSGFGVSPLPHAPSARLLGYFFVAVSGIVFVADYLKVCGIVVRICKSDTADRFLLADRTV